MWTHDRNLVIYAMGLWAHGSSAQGLPCDRCFFLASVVHLTTLSTSSYPVQWALAKQHMRCCALRSACSCLAPSQPLNSRFLQSRYHAHFGYIALLLTRKSTKRFALGCCSVWLAMVPMSRSRCACWKMLHCGRAKFMLYMRVCFRNHEIELIRFGGPPRVIVPLCQPNVRVRRGISSP